MRRSPDGRTLLDFGSEFLVACPRCAAQAWVRDRGAEAEPSTRARPARFGIGQIGANVALTCANCGLSRFWAAAAPGELTAVDPKRYPPGVVAVGAPVDWYFHLPLWLQTPCCGETLWAYNAAHLTFLEDFVRATLREHARGPYGWRNQALGLRYPMPA